MALKKYSVKDPAENIQYSMDFSLVIPNPNETIATSTWTIAAQTDAANVNVPAMLGATSRSGKICSSYVTGGTSGTTYILSCTVGTSANETVKISGILPVKTFK